MQNLFSFILCMILSHMFSAMQSFGQKLQFSVNAGLIHNTIISKPKLESDTIATLYGEPNAKSFPSSGILIGAEAEKNLEESNFSIKLGLDYSHYISVIKFGFLQRNSTNPLIESNLTLNAFSTTGFVTYNLKKVSFDAGCNFRVMLWYREKAFLLNGESYETSFTNKYNEILVSFLSRFNVEIIENLRCSIGYSPEYGPMFESPMIYLGINFRFKKI